MFYVASIYSLGAKTDSELDVARRQYRYEYVMKRTHELMQNGNFVYSPIVHCHEMALKYGNPKDYSFYKDNDRHFVKASEGVIALDMVTHDGKTWKDSEGMSDEIAYAKANDIPVIILECSDFYDGVIIKED